MVGLQPRFFWLGGQKKLVESRPNGCRGRSYTNKVNSSSKRGTKTKGKGKGKKTGGSNEFRNPLWAGAHSFILVRRHGRCRCRFRCRCRCHHLRAAPAVARAPKTSSSSPWCMSPIRYWHPRRPTKIIRSCHNGLFGQDFYLLSFSV